MRRDFEIQLYNSLTRKKEAFRPIDESNVRIYVCGPTVYDHAHIGNARPVIVFDVLYRLMRYRYGPGHVTYVRNITDVDDKINARAAERGISIRQLTEETEAQFHRDMAALGCLDPDVEPRATEHIDEMKAMIEALVERGHAYVAADHVLFDVTSMPDYGQLSGRTLEDNEAGARVAVEDYKRNPGDFVLWKPSRPGEPGWPSPCGIAAQGRPGWHIECSAMSDKWLWQLPLEQGRLGEAGRSMAHVFDIHGGGVDLKFPHHENEIAQSTCAHGTPRMANYWVHNGFLQVEGQKMAKSLGNFITVHELLQTENFGGRRWPGEVIRLAMLMTHYREPLDFSLARLQEAEAELNRWREKLLALGLSFNAGDRGRCDQLDVPAEVIESLASDINTVTALQSLQKLAKAGGRGDAEALYAGLEFLGLVNFETMSAWQQAEEEKLATIDIRRVVEERLEHIRNRNFAEADRIRAELAEQGIQLKDGKDPDTGERITTWEVKR